MKIAVTTSGNSLEGAVDSRFGRAPRFLIVDTSDGSFEAVDNIQNLNAAQGAGIQSAMTVVKTGAAAVITGHCGPKAFHVLAAAGIKVFNTDAATVKDAIELYENGLLAPLASADVEGHWI
ncbi:MAG: NifB/NifX family molybdenum-iron cluster-binding protein [Victivallaceae bacterium]|nr:NifB/NifX family molybdenum-iron cluster-binding protein [Victivallaceae bacterium]